ncbi:MAG: SCO family protein [SAR202 cluster bacterium]|nr:SCO family protein [SAR202 cluster bacterium]
MIYFGYTYCPDVCPMSLADMLKVKRALGDRADEITFLMITVDPERDTPAALKNRLSVFDPTFLGLYGERPTLEAIWDDFGVSVVRENVQGSAAGYLIAHSAFLYLVGRDGELHVQFPFGALPEDMVKDINRVLDEGVN